MPGKGNEELKAKIAKIQQKGKAPADPVPPVQEETVAEQPGDEDMEALNAEFEAKKKALMQKKAPQTLPAETGEVIEEALAEYSNDAKFRVELIFQLVQLNKSMKEIADALKSFANNGQ